MKRKIFVIAIAVLLLLTFATVNSAAEGLTALGSGFTDVPFSNGYRGFCIDAAKAEASNGDSFTMTDTSVAKNNNDNTDISQKLKILFVHCFTDLFVSDGNGGYVLDSLKKDSSIPYAIYDLTDNRYNWGEGKTLVNKVNAYTGPAIPDDGHQITLENGDVITFHFAVAEPQKEGQQSFFLYKIEVSKELPHEHDHSDEWSSDEDEHWHECECGDKIDVDEHKGNTPDCVTPSTCDECGKELSKVDPENHTGKTEIRDAKPATEYEDGYTGDTYCADCGELLEEGKVIPATHEHNHSDEWSSDDDEHWHECECGDKDDIGPHIFVDGECIICGKVDSDFPVEPDEPDVPDVPDVPDEPDVPDVPDEPDIPDVPDEPETPEEPGKDEGVVNPDTGDNSSTGMIFVIWSLSLFTALMTMRRKKENGAF